MGAQGGHPASGRAAFLLLWLGALPSPDQGQLEDVRAVLRRPSGTEERTADELADGLVALGPAAVPVLYEIVTGRGLELLVGEEWRPADWSCEPEAIPGLCLLALERAPTDAVIKEIERALADEPSDQDRLVLLRLLGAKGSAAGLALAFRAAAQLGDLELLRPRVRTALREALAAIMRRDPSSWSLLDQALAKLEPATREVLVDAIGDAGLKQGMAVLVRLLQAGQPSRAKVVENMARLECARPWDLAGQTMEHAARLLNSQEAAERALAARVAGSVQALEVIPELIGLVDDPEPLVSRCAVEALAALADLPLGSESGAWEAWHQRERIWRETSWTPLLDALVSARPGPANEALRELVQHPLYRHEAALAIADCLALQPHAVALAACAELEALGSLWALPGLIATLEQAQPQLRAAAWRALRALTGEERKLAPALWRSLVDA